MLVLRGQFFECLRETLYLYKHALGHLKAASSEKSSFFWKKKTLFSAYGKRLTIIDLFEGPLLVGTHFRR